MDANKIRLLEFIGTSKKTFNIPVYQRNYDWKHSHCERLFRDIENIAKNNLETDHFIGTVVYVLSSVQPTYQELVLIDGQQRITSITLLLKALYDVIEDEDTREDILETYLINKRAPEKLRVKLKPIESDAASYNSIIENEGGNPNSNLYKNYKKFKNLIEESEFTPMELYNAMNNVELVYIQLDKDKRSENPQLIFESLNSTGLSLTQGDLIRNFLLMNHTYEEQNRLYKEYWMKIEKFVSNAGISDFVRDYLTMKINSIPTKDKVYDTFKIYAKAPKNNFDEEGILEELRLYAQYYSWFLSCGSPYPRINNYLSQLQQIKSTVPYPALLSFFEDCFEYNKFNVEELAEILKVIVSYLYRRLICTYPTNALNKIFATLANEVEKSNKISFHDKILDVLTSKTSTGTFPRSGEFHKEFVRKDLYKTKIDKYTLCQIESYNSKEIVEMNDNITVEHIMPQKLNSAWRIELGSKYTEIHSEYLHTVGNLTLTGYNGNLSNKSFMDKKVILADSNISISRNLAGHETWNADMIKDRAEELYLIAEKIWELPEEYDRKESEQIIDYGEEYNIMDEINVTGEKPKSIIIMDVEHIVTSWKDVLRKMSEDLYDLDQDLFSSFVLHNDFSGRGRRIIGSSDKDMNSPYQLADNIFVETHLNANAIINYCKLMAEHYEIQEEIYFSLRA